MVISCSDTLYDGVCFLGKVKYVSAVGTEATVFGTCCEALVAISVNAWALSHRTCFRTDGVQMAIRQV